MIEYRQEKSDTCLEELIGLLPSQWAHTGDPELGCQPNWAFYLELEKHGGLVVWTAREAGKLVGYLLVLAHRHLNSMQTRVATISTYFVEERGDRALILRRLISTAINSLERRGIYYLSIETNFEHSCGRLLEAMGFTPRKIGYTIRLGAQLDQEVKSA